jgi:hypothetical protein
MILGVDERRVDSTQFLDDLSKMRCFGQAEARKAREKLDRAWRRFPGIVPVLWKALGGTAGKKTTAA